MAAVAIAVVMGLGAALPVLAQDGEGKVGTQVVGGTPVPEGKYPFMTSIQADTSDRPPYKEYFCGGTLIDEDSVLTAAHCAVFIGRKTTERTLGYKDVRLEVGVTVLNSDQGQRRRIERLSDIRIHPDYNGVRNNKFDAAVIQLARPINNIDPIELAEPASGTRWRARRPRPSLPVGEAWSRSPRSATDLPQIPRGGCEKLTRRSSPTPIARTPTSVPACPSAPESTRR